MAEPAGQPERRRSTRGISRRQMAVAATSVGGMLWALYGFLAMLTPWGAEVVYQEAQGYSVVLHGGLFVLYSLPGGLALVLTSWGLIQITAHLRQPSKRIDKLTLALAFVATFLGLASVVGVILQLDPLFSAARIFGTLVLGLATTMAAVMAHRAPADRGWVVVFALTGLLGLSLFPLWPLVYAFAFVTMLEGALIIALFGVGWLVIAGLLWRRGQLRSTLV